MEERIKKVEKMLYNHNNLIEATETKEFLEGKSSEIDEMDKLINLVNDALDSIMYDKYYEIIEYYYLQDKDIKYILYKLDINRNTFFKHKRRLLVRLTDFIFSSDYIKDLFREIEEV